MAGFLRLVDCLRSGWSSVAVPVGCTGSVSVYIEGTSFGSSSCLRPEVFDVLLVRRAVRGLMGVIGVGVAYMVMDNCRTRESDSGHSFGVSIKGVRPSVTNRDKFNFA